MPDSPHVFLDELPWDMRSRNTDWRLVRFAMPQLANFESGLSFTQQHSSWIALLGNIKLLRAAVGRRVGRPLSRLSLNTSHLSARELSQSGANVVFNHRAYPLNAGTIPVVWQSAIIDPKMQRSYGASEADIQAEVEVKAALFARAAVVQVSTQAEASRHAEMFPKLAEKFVPVPMFLPSVQACTVEEVSRQMDAPLIRLLFVGNHAKRKGLDLLLEAYANLPKVVQARSVLTIMSNFDRSAMKVPSIERIHIIRGASNQQVMTEMRRSHVLINLARLESYGIVFLEAMSQGLACIGPDWEVQRELFDDGHAGMNLPFDFAALYDTLVKLISDGDIRYRLGMAARARFEREYAPGVTARKYKELFCSVARP